VHPVFGMRVSLDANTCCEGIAACVAERRVPPWNFLPALFSITHSFIDGMMLSVPIVVEIGFPPGSSHTSEMAQFGQD
jgi:hypothetical protein